MPVVNLTIAAQVKGLAQANAQLARMTKTLQGLARATGLTSSKGAIRGAASTSMLGTMGFDTKQIQQLTAYQKGYDQVLRAGMPGLVNSVKFQNKHAGALKILNGNTKNATKSLKNLNNTTGMTGRQSYYAGMMVTRLGYAFVAMAAAITGLGVLSVKTFATFQSSLADIRGLASLTSEQTDYLGGSMRELSKETMFSAQEIAKAGVALARTGIIGQKGLKGFNDVMEASIILAGGFRNQGVTLEKTVESVTRTMNQFGYSSDQAGRVIKALAGGAANTMTDIEKLQKGLSYAGAASASLGNSLEETIAILGLLSNMGIEAGRGGRMYRNILVRLSKATTDGTTKQKKLFEQMKAGGIEIDKINLKTQSMVDVLKVLKGAQFDLAEATDTVRQRAVVAFMVLMRDAGRLEELTEAIKNSDVAFELYALQLETLSVKFKKLSNTVQAFAISIGAVLAPSVSKAVDGLAQFFKSLDKLSPLQKRLLLITTGILAFGLALSGVVLIVKGFIMSAMFGPAQIALLFKTIGLSILGVIGPLAALAAGFIGIVLAIATARVVLKEFNSTIDLSVDKIVGFAPKLLPVYWLFYGLALTIDKVRTKFKGLGEAMQKEHWMTVNAKRINAYANQLMKLGVEAKEARRLAATELWESEGSEFKKAKDAVVDFGKKVTDEMVLIKDELMGLFDGMLPNIGEKLDALIAKVKATMGAVQDDMADTNERAKDLVGDLAGTTDDIIKRISQSWADNIFNLIKGTTTFAEVWQSFLDDALKNFIHGFMYGMLKGWQETLGQMVAEFVRAQYFMAGIRALLNLGGGMPSVNTSATSSATTAASTQAYQAANPGLFVGATGGIVTRPTLGLIGEAGPEAVIPLDEYNRGGGSLTIINVVDTNFVNAQIAQDPDTVINVINADLIRGGSTRKTIKRIR